ncbi:fibronectin type III domain-containing protein [Streptomyces sp. NPDC058459]|uniref:fibronectin type III domain-containing protein n=1 Tax=Streptomyces sp. NPDC058459 TaxID=3346508 RepID=UPI003655C8BA
MTTRTRVAAAALTAALATAGGLLTATPASAVTCASPSWTAQYYANTSFKGTPKLTACDSAISENYGYGDPAGVTLPKDNFSVRWSVTRDFGSGGPFRLAAATQDGIRVYIDGARRIDLWRNVSSTVRKTVDLSIPAGRHTLRVDYVAWTGYASAAFTYTPRTDAQADTVKPLAPAGPTAAYDRTTAKATLRWTPNKEMDLAGYRVYRRLSDTAWTKVSGTKLLTSPSFADLPPVTGQTFFYEARAVDKAGHESTGSADVSATTADRTAPATPAGLTATDGQDGVALAWQPVPGAAEYTVFRRRQAEPGFPEAPVTQVATVPSPSWTDKAAAERTAYTYYVAAVDAAGNPSATRATASAARGDHAPAPATGMTAVFKPRTGIVLRWTPSTSDDVDRYDLYRDGHLYRAGVWGATYTDETVDRGHTYTYTVVAVDRAGNRSPVSAPASATTDGDDIAPAPVTGLKATPREDGVLLEWNPNTESDLARYEVLRAVKYDDGDGGHVWIARSVQHLGPDATSFLHPSAPDGEDVLYAVIASDTWENQLRFDDETVNWVEVTELGTPTED